MPRILINIANTPSYYISLCNEYYLAAHLVFKFLKWSTRRAFSWLILSVWKICNSKLRKFKIKHNIWNVHKKWLAPEGGRKRERCVCVCVGEKSQDLCEVKSGKLQWKWIILSLFSLSKVLLKRFELKEINPIALVCVCYVG